MEKDNNDKELQLLFISFLAENGILFQYSEKFNLKRTMNETHESSWCTMLFTLDCGKPRETLQLINLLWHRKLELYNNSKYGI